MGKTKSELYEIKKDPFDESDAGIKLRAALFRNVSNAAELKRKLEAGEFEASFIKPELVAEVFILLAAASRAASVKAHNKMVTKSIHSEIVYSLSPSKNITESLRLFGIADDSTDLLIAIADDEKGSKLNSLAKHIKGTSVPLTDLKDCTDYEHIKEVYHVKDPELNKGSITDAILSRIVSKDYIA